MRKTFSPAVPGAVTCLGTSRGAAQARESRSTAEILAWIELASASPTDGCAEQRHGRQVESSRSALVPADCCDGFSMTAPRSAVQTPGRCARLSTHRWPGVARYTRHGWKMSP